VRTNKCIDREEYMRGLFYREGIIGERFLNNFHGRSPLSSFYEHTVVEAGL